MTANIEAKKLGHFIDDKGRILGIVFDMPEGQYHPIRAFSYSGSKQFGKSPAHFQAYLEKEWEIDPDREQFKAIHALCHEDGAKDKIVIKDGRWAGALKEEVKSLQASGKLVLKQEAYDTAIAVSNAVKSHGLAGQILSRALGEVSIFWIHNGVYCKGRIDSLYLDDEDIIIGDTKNFGDISRDRILWKFIHDNRYYWQMYFYSMGIEAVLGRKPTNHHWFFLENEKPYGVKVRTCTSAMLELAETEMKPLFETYKQCEESGVWPSYKEEAEEAGLPSYAWEIL